MAIQPTLPVFVYGTLKPGEANYPSYCSGRVNRIVTARARGRLFDLPVGYPAAVAEGHDRSWIAGYLLLFADGSALKDLDRLEDYQPGRRPEANEYQRRFVPVSSPLGDALGHAWAYFMLPERVQGYGGRLLSAGNWRSRTAN